jgi:hypothetical protein
MTVHDAAGARVMQRLGVERVVLARENTLEDIRAIREALIALLPDGRHVVAGVAVRAALGAARGFAVPAEAIRYPHTRE